MPALMHPLPAGLPLAAALSMRWGGFPYAGAEQSWQMGMARLVGATRPTFLNGCRWVRLIIFPTLILKLQVVSSRGPSHQATRLGRHWYTGATELQAST